MTTILGQPAWATITLADSFAMPTDVSDQFLDWCDRTTPGRGTIEVAILDEGRIRVWSYFQTYEQLADRAVPVLVYSDGTCDHYLRFLCVAHTITEPLPRPVTEWMQQRIVPRAAE